MSTMIESVYDRLFEKASEIVASGEEHQPILIIIHDDGSFEAVPVILADMPPEVWHFAQRKTAEKFGAAVLITEAWTLETMGKLNENGEYDGPMPSEHPDRKEAVMFNVLTPTRQALATCPIDRATNTLEKRPLQWLDQLPEGAHIGGRMVRENAPSVN